MLHRLDALRSIQNRASNLEDGQEQAVTTRTGRDIKAANDRSKRENQVFNQEERRYSTKPSLVRSSRT